jgi:hypothetical protein
MRAQHAKKVAAHLSPSEVAARDRRLARAAKAGVGVTDLARRFDLDTKAVYRICASMGVTPASRKGARP